jgi:hypothetical protein
MGGKHKGPAPIKISVLHRYIGLLQRAGPADGTPVSAFDIPDKFPYGRDSEKRVASSSRPFVDNNHDDSERIVSYGAF